MGRFIKSLAPLVAAIGMLLASFSGVASVAAQDTGETTIVVGSKNFTESIVLSEMVALLLEDAGYTVERQLNLGGTAVAHQALVNDEIDVYVEYTGTGLLAILGQQLPSTGGDTATPVAGATPQPHPTRTRSTRSSSNSTRSSSD